MTRLEILQIAKPIIFSSEMVRAILDDRKTETRRVMKPQPKHNGRFWEIGGAGWSDGIKVIHPVPEHSLYNRMPYKPGDYLYVRETWAWFPCWDCGSDTDDGCIEKGVNRFYNGHEYGCYGYRASFKDDEYPSVDTWHLPIYMQKEAARIFLRVTDVRVEQLQEIKEFRAEGIQTSECCDTCHTINHGCFEERSACGCDNEVETFAEIWDSTIAQKDCDKYGWAANPWVWMIQFEREEVRG